MRQDGQATAPKGITVHNIHILDASGSMGYGHPLSSKYTNALGGINEEFNVLKGDISGVNYTQTIVEFDSGNGMNGIAPGFEHKTAIGKLVATFSGSCRQTTHYFMTPLAACSPISGRGAFGGTPLYQTVGEVIEKILAAKQPEDKVILKIFTDGEENSSTGKYARTIATRTNPLMHGVTDCPALKSLIDAVQENSNFTVTFIGTQGDVSHAINNLGMMSTNTLIHDNTASGVRASYNKMSLATTAYSSAATSGASVDELKGNFFKRVVDEPPVEEPKVKSKVKTKK